MFDGLITGMMAGAVMDTANENDITELRLRVSRPLIVQTITERKIARMASGVPYVVTRADLDRVLGLASDFSVYAVNDELVKGYMARKGIRIGVAGEGVADRGNLLTMKHISFLTIRIPHQITGAADRVRGKVFADGIRNTLIISPPGGGKTTMLRELARIASKRFNTLVIDERFELAAADKGIPSMDVGDCDVVSGVSKSLAYENSIRAMNPELIVTDEIFRKNEIEAVTDIARSGVKIFASVHGADFRSIENSELFAPLLKVFETFIVLSSKPRAGTVAETLLKDADARGTL